MSGGSYDYVYSRIHDAAREVERAHRDQPHVVAFARLLAQCGDVMYAIEWADSCDTIWDAALDAKIRGVVSPAHELAETLADAGLILERLKAAIRRAEGGA